MRTSAGIRKAQNVAEDGEIYVDFRNDGRFYLFEKKQPSWGRGSFLTGTPRVFAGRVAIDGNRTEISGRFNWTRFDCIVMPAAVAFLVGVLFLNGAPDWRIIAFAAALFLLSLVVVDYFYHKKRRERTLELIHRQLLN